MKKKLKSILVIDDDPAMNFINQKLLEIAGVSEHIKVVMNGREAIEYLSSSGSCEGVELDLPQPDLILLDINMPVMNGWQFLDEVQKLWSVQKREIRIVVLTSSGNPDDQSRARKHALVTDFKNKPLTMQMIDELMEKYSSNPLPSDRLGESSRETAG